MGLKFESEAVKFLKTIEQTNKSVFLTGKAGSGKSTAINFWKDNTKKKYILLGTTGVSAEMIGGLTIHRFFNLKPGNNGSWFCAMKDELREYIKELDVFVIDEGSMNRADLFDMLNKIMKGVMGNDLFFGGKQLVMVGDLFQLPPVPEKKFIDREKTKENPAFKKYNDKYNGKLFFFDSDSFSIEDFEIIQLEKVYRQDDIEFVDMLNRVRLGDNRQDILNYFNQKIIEREEIHPKAILLSTTNQIANNFNRKKLDELPGQTINNKAYITGEFPVEFYPNDLWINYKIGARVIFKVNHKDGYYVNGTLGTVKEIYGSSVLITKDNGENVEVGRNMWQNTDGVDGYGNPIILGTFTQYPFRCAFAITIHSCQGKSFDNIAIDLGWGAFSAGQVYVALSRVRSFEGLQLITKLKAKDIFCDQDVKNFLK